ncbi:MAG: Uncharacterised protein [Flavobacteriia bacterium]|nr:MAG: Uncharacterised protein [Flavobacteriia bacterium]
MVEENVENTARSGPLSHASFLFAFAKTNLEGNESSVYSGIFRRLSSKWSMSTAYETSISACIVRSISLEETAAILADISSDSDAVWASAMNDILGALLSDPSPAFSNEILAGSAGASPLVREWVDSKCASSISAGAADTCFMVLISSGRCNN